MVCATPMDIVFYIVLIAYKRPRHSRLSNLSPGNIRELEISFPGVSPRTNLFGTLPPPEYVD
jgi:hypothetical protein